MSGPVGTGKTELVHTFAEIAAATGMRLGTATCTPAEQRLPLGVLSQLLPVPLGVTELSPVQLHELGRLVTASDTPLLIAVDDIQHADSASLDCLFYIARRISGVRVMLVLTEADGPLGPLHAGLVRERHCHRVRVAGFSEPETALLVGARAAEVHRVTGGNPLLVHAVSDAASLREDYLACVHRSHPFVGQVALALAVLGSSAAADTVSQLTGLDPAVVPRVLSAMTHAGLVLDFALRHPSAATYLLDDLPRHARGDLFLRAARLLYERGSPAAVVAPCLAAADRPLAVWAAPVLTAAAEQSLLDGAADVATRYLELAARTAVDDACRAAVRSRLAGVEWHECPATAARHIPALLAASRAGLLDAQQEISLVRQLLWHGRAAEAGPLLTTMSDPLGAGPLASWLYCHLPGHAGPMTTHRPHNPTQEPPLVSWSEKHVRTAYSYERAFRSDQQGGGGADSEPWARATVALEAVLKGWTDVTVAEELLQGARTHGVSDYRITALATLIYAGALDDAEPWCDQLLDSTQRSTTLRAQLLSSRAEISLRRGDLDTAARVSAEALTTLSREAWGISIGYPLSSGLLAVTRAGDLTEAAALAEIPVPSTMYETRAGVHYLFARGHHHLACGRNHAALSDFLLIGETLHVWEMEDIVPWRAGAAEVWLKQGNRDRARELVSAKACTGHELRVFAACAEKKRRPALLTTATELLESGDQYELARTLADLSRAWQAVGDHRRARMTLRRAWHVAKQCGAHQLCQKLMPDEHAAVTGIDALSEAERRVAALAATGYTNREIADKLFITSSTVEQHLTRVYRKLNVKYRTDLPADVAG